MQETSQSSLMQLMRHLVDLVLLNVLFFASCLPIVTIGAASTALYSVAFSLEQPQEHGLLRRYFRAFRESWKQSTAVFGLIGLFAAASVANIARFLEMGNVLGYGLFAFSVMLLLTAASIYSYAFPLLSRFRNTLSHTLQNALVLALQNLPRTLILLIGNCFPLMVLDSSVYTFLRLSSVWMLIYFSAAAWFHTKVLKKVFDPLIEQAEANQTPA